ncbi:TlpA family protein disulfide reductase [Sphingomonas baiyangensis]|uniref:TlpA family protein disulfide reductase n=1 Tax=Sphingomonas baiyangensis TaxID=2572576 RepID=UPI002016992E|nr:TlpA disulfide reductase family protein [Sphingomonas baiyangensis]
MRSAIALLLGLGLFVGGCDRQEPAAGQAGNAAAPAPPLPPQAEAPVPAGQIDRSHKGEAAPDFAFADPLGKTTTLAAYRGTPVLMNLWATWCAPCVKEMPTLEALAAREGSGLKVLTISQDLDGPAKVVPYFNRAGFTRLEPWSDPELRFSVGLGANLPTTVLYDAEGKEVWRVTGALDWAGEEAARLLGEATG